MFRMINMVLGRAWLVSVFVFVAMPDGAALGAPAAKDAQPPKLPASYNSVEDLYAALAKYPENQRQDIILKGAQKERQVLVYGAAEERQTEEMTKDFERRYPGIKVLYFRSMADQVVSKMLMEVRANRWYFDVASVGPGYRDLKEAKAIAKHYGLVARSNYPKKFVGADWFGVEMLPLLIAYNKDQVKASEAPKSYKDLLDPKWKGKVSIDADPFNLLCAMIKAWGKERTADWLDKFVNGNQALIRNGHTTQTKMLIAGEFPVASELYAYRLEMEIQTVGAPIEWVIPQDLIESEIPGWIVSRRAPHPYGALLYARYRTSKEAQDIYAKFGRISLHPETQLTYPRLKPLITSPTLERMTMFTVEDNQIGVQANELIEKYIAPRVRAKS